MLPLSFLRRIVYARPFAASAFSSAAPTTGAVQVTADRYSRAALRDIAAADGALRAAYDAQPQSYSANAQAPDEAPLEPGGATVLRKRLLYRSRQRGWLEVDLLMGGWAAARLHTPAYASVEALRAVERILNLETADLFALLQSGDVAAAPAELRDDPVLADILEWTRKNPVASPAAYASTKRVMAN